MTDRPPTVPRSPREAATELGVSERTVYRLIKEKKLRAARVGQQLRILPGEIARILDAERLVEPGSDAA